MIKPVQINYTDTFANTFDDVIDHLAPHTSESQVLKRLEKTIDKFENLVGSTPFAAPISQTLLDLGITLFREYNNDGFRLLYRVIETPENTIIFGDVFLTQKQNTEQALINYCLLHK
ncbi:type II toxin-antitoxin system RelE/ParE family toxin [Photobacterium sp. Hal280]|uniref:type II toxin-antitoxin system RelE/ParE family toxin n=1 Tax=Photobacterium sp. Hal280 TaxID=3035163 RepID=UPI00301D99FB